MENIIKPEQPKFTVETLDKQTMFEIIYPTGGGKPDPRFRHYKNGGVFKYFHTQDLTKSPYFKDPNMHEQGKQFYPVVKEGDLIVGIAQLEKNPYTKEPIYWIKYISIDPKYQGRSFATKLVEEIFRFAAEKGFTLENSSYSKEGWKKVRHLIKRFALQYQVPLIDEDRKIY